MRRIYYGWWIVAASMLVYTVIIGSCFSAFGLFVKPVSAEFDLSRAEMNTALILLNVGNAVLAPFVGRLLDRVPVKGILVVSALLIGGSLATLGLSGSVLLDAAVIALPLAGGVLAGTMAMSVLIARWFVVYRGRAMVLAVIGQSLGGIIAAPAAGWLIEAEGWRLALIIIAAAVTVLLLAVSLVVRERPGADDIETPGATPPSGRDVPGEVPEQKPAPALAVLRMPQFWSISLAIAIGLAIPQALMISIVPMALEQGHSTIQAAGLISAAGIAAIVGKLLLAVVADKIERIFLLAGIFALGSITCTMLLLSHTYELLLCSAALMGVTSGTISPIYYALVADRFGLASFGTVRGLIVPITAGVGAVSVRFIGEVFDHTGDYDAGFAVFIAADLLAAALMLTTRYTRPVAAAVPLARPAST